MKHMILEKICRELIENPNVTQRELVKHFEISLGKINGTLREGIEKGLLLNVQGNYRLTEKGRDYLNTFKVDNAIIMAAGFGARCAPLTFSTPKGLLKVNGVPMIERQIEQLLEKGIKEIIIVVGYLKEQFDYLIDKYNVKLVYNPDYTTRNNFASIYHAADFLKNSYILCSDNWIEENIFNSYEIDSWYCCLYMAGSTDEWCVTSDKKNRITNLTIGGEEAWTIVGPAFFSASFSKTFSALVHEYYKKQGCADYYWEHILKEHLDVLPIYMNKQSRDNVYEFENLEELRKYDKSYINNSNDKIMRKISSVYKVPESEINGIFELKDGVTNKSFGFSIGSEKFVLRYPGKGTEKLVNRVNEKNVYEQINSMGIADEIISFDAASGIKISRFYENSVIADPFNDFDLKVSMNMIHKVHTSNLEVKHTYNVEKMIQYYYSLAKEAGGIHFLDIDDVYKQVQHLIDVDKKLNIPHVLCHGDYAHTNILILADNTAKIIDWEYSGMGDPIMDISLYCIYAYFDRNRIDLALNLYFQRKPTKEEYLRAYMYVALGSFMWCMWAEYKQANGQEFGEYPMRMYRYMKDFYKILCDEGYIDDTI